MYVFTEDWSGRSRDVNIIEFADKMFAQVRKLAAKKTRTKGEIKKFFDSITVPSDVHRLLDAIIDGSVVPNEDGTLSHVSDEFAAGVGKTIAEARRAYATVRPLKVEHKYVLVWHLDGRVDEHTWRKALTL